MLLTDLFADSVAQHGERVAIDVPPGPTRDRVVVRYAELARMAAALRQRLSPFVTGEAVVAIHLPRHDPWLFAAQLAVLQAGAAHVCLDPSFPAAHVQHVLKDAAVVAVIAAAAGERACGGRGVPIVRVPLAGEGPTLPAAPRPAWLDERGLAYVIYTSGSTGAPKGVLIEHRGAVNLIRQGVQRFGLGPGDRIAQGSSAAYDSSIEETWLALASGATVVVMDDETVRLGPDLVPWLAREAITVLCPPPTLLRAMDCDDPRARLPKLRLCYVGGEALTADLAATWGKALWLENGYGPTECTVTVVRGRVAPDRPVTIGEPVPPHRAFLLDDRLQPVADGDEGELCLAGPGLARGYVGQPELTAQRFPELPGIGRVYRTGDLAVRGADGQLTCLGRIDSQVKLRGFRIELEAIESVLATCDGVREVACAVVGQEPAKQLIAFVVATALGPSPEPRALAAALRRTLPDHMVPSRFELLSALPRTLGGKVDRRRLAANGTLPAASVDTRAENAPADADPLRRELRAGIAAVLGLPLAQVGADDDFFDLGGDSLRAALLVSRLRRGGCATFAVRDVYSARSANGMLRLAATKVRAPAAISIGPDPRPRPTSSTLRVVATTTSQLLFLLLMLLGITAVARFVTFDLTSGLCASLSLPVLLLVLPWLFAALRLAFAVASVLVLVVAKRLLIGRYHEGSTPAWSGLHLRHWLVVRCARLLPWGLFEGTEATAVVLRLLGARVGRRVHVHRGVDLAQGGWDLLTLGDDATLGREACLGLVDRVDGQLVFGAVELGAGATLATRAGTAGQVVIGAGALVGALSFVTEGTHVPAGERWQGVPATTSGPAPAPAPIDHGHQLSSWTCTWLLLLTRLAGPAFAALPWSLLAWWLLTQNGIDGARLATWLFTDGQAPSAPWGLALVAFAVLLLPLSLLSTALALRSLPKVPAGTHPRWSLLHLRQQLRDGMLEFACGWLSGTLFWPWWLALAGARIGRDVEVSTILDTLPEHLAIGAGSFLADGVYLGAPLVHGGRVTVGPTALGLRTFVGNHVVIEQGLQLPDDLLLGISTIADRQMREGTAWFGQPAFQLPRREVVTVDRRLTHAPGPVRYLNRMFWEALRMTLPALPVALGLWWLAVTAGSGFGVAVVATAVVMSFPVLLVWALKWLLLGRVRPGQHGLWSCWASRWDFHYVVWQRFARGLLSLLEGTLLLPWFLRAMGMRIGRRCLLGDGFAQVVDPDMITIDVEPRHRNRKWRRARSLVPLDN
ncbi:MAG: amino acid adenylation domain-containing protein [Planctomycetes bacterium]|nr:amino acid adenylation domain-containing protein [Planctomycetota bacterium]